MGIGGGRGPKLAPLGRVWAPWHLFLRLRGTARAAKAARVAILVCSAARKRARRRAIGEPLRHIDAPGWALWALGVVGDLNWRLWIAPGLRGTFFCASAAPRAPPRPPAWPFWGVRRRVKARAVARSVSRSAALTHQGGPVGTGGGGGPKLAPLGRVWAPWHLFLRLRGTARAAEAARAAIWGCSAARERARRRAIGELVASH